jgi:hypothetical protein
MVLIYTGIHCLNAFRQRQRGFCGIKSFKTTEEAILREYWYPYRQSMNSIKGSYKGTGTPHSNISKR